VNPAEVTATLPQTMMVDYVRVYQEADSVHNFKKCEFVARATVILRHHGKVLVSIPIRESDLAFPLTLSIYTLKGKKVVWRCLPDPFAVRDIELPCGLAVGVYSVAIETESRTTYYRLFGNTKRMHENFHRLR
jgi:hypothetical protein